MGLGLGKLFSGGAGELVESVGGVLDNLTTSKEEKLNELSKDDVVSIAKQFKIRIPFKKLDSVAKPRLIEKILYQKENRSLDTRGHN